MDPNLAQRLSRIAPRQTLTLTHHGRKTGKPYDVTIWFAVEDDRIFLGTNNTTNWARNVMAKPQVTIKAGAEILRGTVRQLTAPGEREHARSLMLTKYWWAAPFIVGVRLLQQFGVMKDTTVTFEVIVDSTS